MAKIQKYGIKYPFQNENNDLVYIDLNENHSDYIKSKVLHVLFTKKGQKLRDPDFGTNLLKFIFEPSDDITFDDLKSEIKNDISKYVKDITFKDISVVRSEENEEERIVMVHYIVNETREITSVGVKI